MTSRRALLRLLLTGALLSPLTACGKKGPPKRPDGSSGMKIDREKYKKRQ